MFLLYLSNRIVKLKASNVVATCTGGDLFIETAAVFNESKQKILIDTGSMVSIIEPNLFNTPAILPSTTTLSTVEGDSIIVHGKVTFPLKIPSLRRSNFHEFYVVNVSCNILGIDFLVSNKFSIDCKNGLLKDNTTALSTTTNFTKLLIAETNVYKFFLGNFKDVVGDVDFKGTVQHRTVHRIELTADGPFETPKKLCPEKYKIAKQCFESKLEC